jgi:hypothetical protein
LALNENSEIRKLQERGREEERKREGERKKCRERKKVTYSEMEVWGLGN